MDFLLELDYSIFYFVNNSLSNTFFDFILPMLRNKYLWIPLYVFILSFIAFNYPRSSFKIIVVLLILVGLSDAISSHVIKKTVKRVRPCNNDYIEVVERIHCGSGYSFTSSHASNHFTIAVFLSLAFVRRKRIRWILYAWAGLISLAQVYVGVHFPLDVICGMILGILIARFGNFIIHSLKIHPLSEVSKA